MSWYRNKRRLNDNNYLTQAKREKGDKANVKGPEKMAKKSVESARPRVIRCCRDTNNYFRVAMTGDRHPKGMSLSYYFFVCRPGQGQGQGEEAE